MSGNDIHFMRSNLTDRVTEALKAAGIKFSVVDDRFLIAPEDADRAGQIMREAVAVDDVSRRFPGAQPWFTMTPAPQPWWRRAWKWCTSKHYRRGRQKIPVSRNAIRAFTLIELILTIAIIALLIGLSLPALQRARHAAWSARCLSNARELSIATSAYIQTYNRMGCEFERGAATTCPVDPNPWPPGPMGPDDPGYGPLSYSWVMPAMLPGQPPINWGNTRDAYNWSRVMVLSDRMDYRHGLGPSERLSPDPFSAQWLRTTRNKGYLDGHAAAMMGPLSTPGRSP